MDEQRVGMPATANTGCMHAGASATLCLLPTFTCNVMPCKTGLQPQGLQPRQGSHALRRAGSRHACAHFT
eukprot:353336-Chlamydomonas_euryale.AAC.10